MVRLLRGMTARDEFEAFYDSLPVAGEDGTLEERCARPEPPLPREDRHDQRRERAVGLLPRRSAT